MYRVIWLTLEDVTDPCSFTVGPWPPATAGFTSLLLISTMALCIHRKAMMSSSSQGLEKLSFDEFSHRLNINKKLLTR